MTEKRKTIGLLFTGTRDIQSAPTVGLIDEVLKRTKIDKNDIATIFAGGSPGIDTLAEDFARDNEILAVIEMADWRKHGNQAGSIRNAVLREKAIGYCTEYVLELRVIGIPARKSRGTWDMLRKAEKKRPKIPFIVHHLEDLINSHIRQGGHHGNNG